MNFKHFILCVILLACSKYAEAQGPLITKTSETTFHSHAPLEDIEAVNTQTTAAINFEKGEIVVKMLIKHFEFENALMQEHFNENYMESEKYPAAIFKGTFNGDAIDIHSDGTHEVDVTGTITIHGVTQPLTSKATIRIEGNKISATTKFIAKTKDFDIEVPSVVVKNIAEEIEVTSNLTFDLIK